MENSPMQVGITGGIGSGKSIICKIFQSLGIPIYDADLNAKSLMTEDASLIASIKKHFGDEAYLSDNQLNRKYIAGKVFGNKQQLDLLNSLVHPAVGTHYKNWVKSHAGKPYVIKEAALLFESGSYKMLDKIITVEAPVDIRINRVLFRDAHRSAKDVQAIIDNQLTDIERNKKADFVITNDDKTTIIPQVIKLHKKFTVLALG